MQLVLRQHFRTVLASFAAFRNSVPAFLALAIVLATGIFMQWQNETINRENARAEVLNDLGLIRARLEGNVNGTLQLVRGLVSTVSTEPNITQERFSQLAEGISKAEPKLRVLAAAPDLVVRAIYPLQGNEKAIGLDYRTNALQREAAFKAMNTAQLVFAGPVDLVQGGRGFIGRFPIFTQTESGERTFWGLVSAVIDGDVLFQDSGLLADDLPVDLAIIGRDGHGEKGELFFGNPHILENNPVTVDVVVPSGSWHLAAVPKGGWSSYSTSSLMLWTLNLIAAILILLPTIRYQRLSDAREEVLAELKANQTELLRVSKRLELALESSKIGVWELNAEDNSLNWDDRMRELYEVAPDRHTLSFDDWERRIHPEDRERVLAQFPEPLQMDATIRIEYRLKLPSGEVKHIRESARSYRDPGEPLRVVGVNWDVTEDVLVREELERANQSELARNAELEAAKAHIEFNALHDSLTGLPNRRFLDDVLARHVDRFDQDAEHAGLLHIDLDRFKQINDTLGHAAGDATLAHVARQLKAAVDPTDFVARVGGDEFVILCTAPAGANADRWNAHLASLADDIIERIHAPMHFDGHLCRFGVSIGIASDISKASVAADLLVHADLALYRAKSRGGDRYKFYNEALRAEIVTTKHVADEILSGIERKEFVPFFQPQFDARTHEVIGVEALARWKHPTRGVIAPAGFIKIAEEVNAVATIDRLILEQTIEQLALWDDAGIYVPKASVNVSASRLHDEDLIQSLRNLKIQPGRLSFELLESIFLDDHDEIVTWNVNQIKELGIDVEIDDFGTGHASIVSLLKLHPNRLKIDRQLIMPVVHSAAQRKLVRSIVNIGKSLNIDVLAEGVETMRHARVMKALGCDALQGYAFARPMDAQTLSEYLSIQSLAAAS